MKINIRKINRGIVLFFILVLGVSVYCGIEISKQGVRTSEANDLVTDFCNELGSFYVWPSDMPDADIDELYDNKEKYLPHLEKGFEKIKPYLYDNAALYRELKEGAVYFLSQNISNGRKPVDVSFEFTHRDMTVTRDTAEGNLGFDVKIRTDDNKNLSLNYSGDVWLEYVDDRWVIVRFNLYSE